MCADDFCVNEMRESAISDRMKFSWKTLARCENKQEGATIVKYLLSGDNIIVLDSLFRRYHCTLILCVNNKCHAKRTKHIERHLSI